MAAADHYAQNDEETPCGAGGAHRCFCGLFRSATTPSNRSRSAALTSKLIPSRMPRDVTPPAQRESYDCVRPLERNLGRSVRDNPLPLALIGIGIGWLMLSGSRRHDGSYVNGPNGWRNRPWMREDRFGGGPDHDMDGRYGASQSRVCQDAETPVHQPMPYEAAAHDDLATKAHEAGANVQREPDESEDDFQDRVYTAQGTVLGIAREAGEAAANFRERVERALRDAAHSVRNLAAEAGAGARRMGERGQSAARGFYDYGRSAAGDVGDRVGSIAGPARNLGGRTVDYVQDQPLLLGALGITVGAVIGMMVPSSRHERRLVGAMRENLSESARQIVGDAGQRISRVAETVRESAEEAARRDGLERTDARGLATAARARHVIEKSGSAGVDAIRRELTEDDERQSHTTPDHERLNRLRK